MNPNSIAQKSDSALVIVDSDEENDAKKEKSLQENFKVFMAQRKVKSLFLYTRSE